MRYTAEHIAFLAENIQGCRYVDLAQKFNQAFGLDVSENALRSFAGKHGLHNGIPRFKKGHIPWNKGEKGLGGVGITRYKKGDLHPRHRPVGGETIDFSGYTIVKVSEPDNWQPKHRVMWEAAYGPIPAGHVLIFADGNKRHIALDNLILITRGQMLLMNYNHLIQDDPELTRSGAIVADIITKCAERKRRSKPKNIKEDKVNEE